MAKTRTILIKETKRKSIELTVNPEQLTIADTVNHTKVTLDQLGDVVIPGKRGLKQVTVSSFLPDKRSPFYNGKTIKGNLKLIEKWKKNQTKVRVIISEPKMNFKALMESDSMTLKEGDHDVYVDWGFIEYKDMSVPTVESIAGLIQVSDPSLNARSEDSAPASGSTEVITSKTTLWALAVKYYGDGTQWTKISAANGNIDPKKLQEGKTLVIP
jgi:nucleoid-associated protein YgaU